MPRRSTPLNYTNVYNTADQLTQIQFPAEGDRAAEHVTSTYDAA